MRAMTAIVFRTQKKRLEEKNGYRRRLLFPCMRGSGRSGLFSWTRKRGRAFFAFWRPYRPIRRGGPPSLAQEKRLGRLISPLPTNGAMGHHMVRPGANKWCNGAPHGAIGCQHMVQWGTTWCERGGQKMVQWGTTWCDRVPTNGAMGHHMVRPGANTWCIGAPHGAIEGVHTSRFWVEKGARKRREKMSFFLAKPYGPGLKTRLR